MKIKMTLEQLDDFYESAVKDLKINKDEAIKAIQENPYIRKKVDVFEKLVAYSLGMPKSRSQAEIMISKIEQMYEESWKQLNAYYDLYSELLKK